MSKEEALAVKVGDKLCYKGGKDCVIFTVAGMKITTPHDLERTGISFKSKGGYWYNYKMCRKWV